MSEAILKFNLPEENPEFRQAMNGREYWLALWDFNQKLFYMVDEEDMNEKFKDPKEACERIHEMFRDSLERYSVNLDEDY